MIDRIWEIIHSIRTNQSSIHSEIVAKTKLEKYFIQNGLDDMIECVHSINFNLINEQMIWNDNFNKENEFD